MFFHVDCGKDRRNCCLMSPPSYTAIDQTYYWNMMKQIPAVYRRAKKITPPRPARFGRIWTKMNQPNEARPRQRWG